MDANSKTYIAKNIEPGISQFWNKHKLFKPEYNSKNNPKKPFSIALPPPNANGPLHLGNISGNIIQDLYGRYYRLRGHSVLLIPGKDHAGIQTEVIFEKRLEKQGRKKRELGREEFYKQAYAFTLDNAAHARSQEQMIGLSADYDREKFTLDSHLTGIVYDTFAKLYEDGKIYRDKRIINWCVKDQTALADIDTEYTEEVSKLYYIAYGPLIVATTRPETKLADTALAVNPTDTRYQKYIGKSIHIESVEGEYDLPVVADDVVDKDFGTGVLKITPGHSKEDFEIGVRHNLPVKTVIDVYGKMSNNAGKYKGMKVAEARKQIVQDLEEKGLLKKVEEYHHNIQICERCKGTIEPLISYQWFLKVQELAQEAIASEAAGLPKIHPQRQIKNYERWLSELHDWCISRQLWWGQRIPAYYCGGKTQYIDENGNVVEKIGENGGCGKIIISSTPITTCPHCKGENMEQDEDIFDTWFSSSQWPFTCLGGTQSDDFKKFYPTSLMETGRDILYFWVARMVMLSQYVTGEVPFHDVYLHGMVLDKDGKKQSKSKGNGIDPTEAIEQYGADALRMSMVTGIAPDQDYRLYNEKVKGYRNFINKIWNASRFILLSTQWLQEKDRALLQRTIENIEEDVKQGIYMKEQLRELEGLAADMTKSLNAYIPGHAGEAVYNFFWHTFCDKWIEESKSIVDNGTKEEKISEIAYLIYILETLLRLLHPFTPFITEYIWQTLKKEGLIKNTSLSIMYTMWPLLD